MQEPFVVVSVTDTGIGIPDEEHDFIFDKFHQVGATTKGVREGTGLGLGDHKASGGTARRDHSGGERAPAREHVPFHPSAGIGRPRRLEAHEKSVGGGRQGNRQGAGPHGSGKLRATRSSRPAMARRPWRKRARIHPDLIILDIHMPGLDGFGVIEKLRREEGFAAIPIIALTASAMMGDRERAMAAGFTGYITKPIRLGRAAGRSGTFVSINDDAIPARAVPADHRRQSRQSGDALQRPGAAGSGNPHRVGSRRGRGSGS